MNLLSFQNISNHIYLSCLSQVIITLPKDVKLECYVRMRIFALHLDDQINSNRDKIYLYENLKKASKILKKDTSSIKVITKVRNLSKQLCLAKERLFWQFVSSSPFCIHSSSIDSRFDLFSLLNPTRCTYSIREEFEGN